jgi:hypothetical protein
VTDHESERGRRCAWCDAPLPDPAGALAVVHGADGTILLTCTVRCLATLVAALAGRPAQDQRYAQGVRN